MASPFILRPDKRPALDLVIAARLPKVGARTGTGAFDAVGDVTVDCDACGWHCAGPRDQVRLAQAEHRRMFHSQITDPLVTLLNRPRQ